VDGLGLGNSHCLAGGILPPSQGLIRFTEIYLPLNGKDAIELLSEKLTRSTAKTTSRRNICVELQIARRIGGFDDTSPFWVCFPLAPRANWTKASAAAIVRANKRAFQETVR
jgi:hypothetical protein